MLRRIAIAMTTGALLATSGWVAPAQAASSGGCTTLWVRDQSADVCKYYWSVGGGYYDGYLQVTRASPDVRVAVSMDGYTDLLTQPGATGLRNFSSIRQAYMRACYNTSFQCTSWW